MSQHAKFDRAQNELTKSLRALRLVAKKIGQNYINGLQADVARLEAAVREAKPDDESHRKQLNQMVMLLRWLSDLDVKPQQDRRRNLKVIDRLITKVTNIMENW